MCTSKTDIKKMMVVVVEEKKQYLLWWAAAGGNYFKRNFGWLLRGEGGEGQNLNGQMLLKKFEKRMVITLNKQETKELFHVSYKVL